MNAQALRSCKLTPGLLFAFLVLMAILLQACGGSSNSSGAVATVSVNPSLASVNVKGQQGFSALAVDSNGNQVLGQVFTWTSSNTSVATIASSGVATGVGPGTTMITATASGVNSQAVTLTVTAVIASITISPMTATIKVGGTQQMTATGVDIGGNTIPVTVSWRNSSASVATISSTGLITGVAPGTVMITANANGISSPVATITVTP